MGGSKNMKGKMTNDKNLRHHVGDNGIVGRIILI